jgi:hypothetical protein
MLEVCIGQAYWSEYWGSGLCPSSRILRTIKHNDSETGLVWLKIGTGGELLRMQ